MGEEIKKEEKVLVSSEGSNELPRINGKSLLGDILAVLNFEKGVFYTLKGLILTPRKTIEEYIKVNRSIHANPIRLLILSTAIFTFLSFSFVYNSNNLITNFDVNLDNNLSPAVDSVSNVVGEVNALDTNKLQPLLIEDSVLVKMNLNQLQSVDVSRLPPNQAVLVKKRTQEVFMSSYFENFRKYSDKLTLLLVPILALFTFLFFRKSGYNYTENLLIGAFLVSLQNAIGIMLIPLMIWHIALTITIFSLTFYGFMIYFWMCVFKQKTVKGFFKSLGALVTSYILYSIFVGVILLFYVFKDLGLD